MPYTDLFLDFDDTLYDTRGNAQIALQELYDHYNLGQYFNSPQDFFDPYWQTNTLLWEQYSKGEIQRNYLIIERFRRPLSAGQGKDGRPFEPTAKQCLEISDTFLGLCSSKPGLVDGAKQLMDHLRSRGYRLHMCSNGFHEVQFKKLKACGLIDYFQTIILSEDAGANKPSSQFFDYAFKTTGANPKTTLMIGDNPMTDIQGAINYGLDTLYFDPKASNHPFPTPPTYKVSSLREIISLL